MAEFAGLRTRSSGIGRNLLAEIPDRRYMSHASTSVGVPGHAVVADDAGNWMLDNGRPYQGVGKMPLNLMGSAEFRAGGASIYQNQAPGEFRAFGEDEPGFVAPALGGLLGLTGIEELAHVGRAFGGAIDALASVSTGVTNFIPSLITTMPYLLANGGLDEQKNLQWQQMNASDPFLAYANLVKLARAQWQGDVQNGRIPGIIQGMGPATNLVETLGAVGNVIGLLQFGYQRGLGAGQDTVDFFDRYGDYNSAIGGIQDEALAAVNQQYQSGAWGTPGSKEARDRAMDELVYHNLLLHDPDKPLEQGLITRQGVSDILFALATDPLFWASFGTGFAKKAMVSGVAARDARFVAILRGADKWAPAMERAMKAYGEARHLTPAQVTGLVEKDPTIRAAIQRMVVKEPQFADVKAQALSEISRTERYWTALEPIAAPIVKVVDALNLNANWFGRDDAARAVNRIMSSDTTQGVIQAFETPHVTAVMEAADEFGPEGFRAVIEEGFGVGANHILRSTVRDDVTRDMVRTAERTNELAIWEGYQPAEIVDARLAVSEPRDWAHRIENKTRDVMENFTARGKGGGEAAVVQARKDIAVRLEIMGASADQAAAMVAKLGRNALSALHLSYFGYAAKRFKAARTAAMKSTSKRATALNPATLGMIAPDTLTVQRAHEIMEQIKAGNMEAVREAVFKYEALRVNVTEDMTDAEIVTFVKNFIENQLANKGLAREVAATTRLPKDLQKWADDNAQFGYKPGYKPENPWHASTNEEGQIFGVNPYLDVSELGLDVPALNRWSTAKERLFHRVRGDAIMGANRRRWILYTTDKWGLSESQANALFSRIMRQANIERITPRAMGPGALWTLIRTHGLGEIQEEVNGVKQVLPSGEPRMIDMADMIPPAVAFDALMHAFRGNWWQVGWSQVITGSLKQQAAGSSNLLGQFAEGTFPTVRYTMNPLFQIQEAIEPFVMNTARGYKVGGKATDMDADTLGLVQLLARANRNGFDDVREMTGDYMWSGEVAKKGFGVGTKLGRLLRVASTPKTIKGKTVYPGADVRSLKQLHYSRATRAIAGKEFVEVFEANYPGVISELIRLYGTTDPGELLINFLMEKSIWSMGREGGKGVSTADRILARMAAVKPAQTGRRDPVNLDQLATLFDDIPDGDGLVAAVMDGTLPRRQLVLKLREINADKDYIRKAWRTIHFPASPEAWYAKLREMTPGVSQTTMDGIRGTMQALAELAQMGEREFLAFHFTDMPMSSLSEDLSRIALTDSDGMYFHARFADAAQGREWLDEIVEEFQVNRRWADREFGLVINPVTRSVVHHMEQTGPWFRYTSGAVSGGSLPSDPFIDQGGLQGMILIHNHPNPTPPSARDLWSAWTHGVAEVWVVGPGRRTVLRPSPSGPPGGLSQRWDPNDLMPTLEDDFEQEYWDLTRARLAQLQESPFYGESGYDPGRPTLPGEDPRPWTDIDYKATELAVSDLAEKYGWEMIVQDIAPLPRSETRMLSFAEDVVANPPLDQVTLEGAAAYGRDPRYINWRGGEQLTVEVAPGTGSPHARLFPHDKISPEQSQRITDAAIDDLTYDLSSNAGVLATVLRRGEGAWTSPDGHFTVNPNGTVGLGGTDRDIDVADALYGYHLQQTEVLTTKALLPGAPADPALGERYAMDFVANRQLSDEEAVELQRSISAAHPDISNWGSSIVVAEDGRTAIRFVYRDNDSPLWEADFLSGPARGIEQSINAGNWRHGVPGSPGEAMLRRGYTLRREATRVRVRSATNDWEARPDGGGYLDTLRSLGQHDLAQRLADDSGRSSTARLASLYRQYAPDEFDAHLATLDPADQALLNGLTDTRGAMPAVPVRDYGPMRVLLPGGEAGLTSSRPYNLVEQSLIKGLNLDPVALAEANPLRYFQYLRQVWASKERDLDDTISLLHVLTFGVHTPLASLPVSEVASAVMRDAEGVAGRAAETFMQEQVLQAQTILARIDPHYYETLTRPSDRAGALGMAFQLERGYFVPFNDVEQMDWVHEVDYLPLQRRATMVEDLVDRAVARGEDPSAAARRIGNRWLRGRWAMFEALPWRVESELGRDASRIVVRRPGVPFKSAATSEAWGNRTLWLLDDIFTTDDPGLQNFLKQQPWESRGDYGIRLSTILPGMQAKTGVLAMSGSGPGQVAYGVYDAWMVRYALSEAARLKQMGRLISPMGGEYTTKLIRYWGGSQRTKTGKIKYPDVPETREFTLLTDARTHYAADPAGTIERMRRNLTRQIPDPELRAMYDNDEVLRLLATNNDGMVRVYGGDYEAMDRFFREVLQPDEVARLRARGHTEAADLLESFSGAEYQWYLWNRARRIEDPHMTLTAGVERLPKTSDYSLALNMARGGKVASRQDGSLTGLWHQKEMEVLGANIFMEDGRAALVLTDKTTVETLVHDVIAHRLSPHFDPSRKNEVMRFFNEKTGATKTAWDRDVEEFLVDEFMVWARTGKTDNPVMMGPLEAVRKALLRYDKQVSGESNRVATKEIRTKAIAAAKAEVKTAEAVEKAAEQEVAAAKGRFDTATKIYDERHAKAGIEELEVAQAAAKAEWERLDNLLRSEKALARTIEGEITEAERRLNAALGTPSAGGIAAGISSKRRKLEAVNARIADLPEQVATAKATMTSYSGPLRGARQRAPLDRFATDVVNTGAAMSEAKAAHRAAKKATGEANQKVGAAEALVVSKKPLPSVLENHPGMGDFFKNLFAPPPRQTVPRSGVDLGTMYSLEEEAMLQQARNIFRRGEEEAYTLHYHNRGRTWLERSINHQFIGLYPFSYMWGKILPEMIRFLVKEPFGIPAPLGGYILTNHIYRQMMIRQSFDEDFREEMAKGQGTMRMFALLMPALPWEIPVNAPLWLRRVAEADLIYQDKVEAGDTEAEMLSGGQFGKIITDMMTYNFGPTQFARWLGTGLGMIQDMGDETFADTSLNVNQVISSGQPVVPAYRPFGSPTEGTPSISSPQSVTTR